MLQNYMNPTNPLEMMNSINSMYPGGQLSGGHGPLHGAPSLAAMPLSRSCGLDIFARPCDQGCNLSAIARSKYPQHPYPQATMPHAPPTQGRSCNMTEMGSNPSNGIRNAHFLSELGSRLYSIASMPQVHAPPAALQLDGPPIDVTFEEELRMMFEDEGILPQPQMAA